MEDCCNPVHQQPHLASGRLALEEGWGQQERPRLGVRRCWHSRGSCRWGCLHRSGRPTLHQACILHVAEQQVQAVVPACKQWSMWKSRSDEYFMMLNSGCKLLSLHASSGSAQPRCSCSQTAIRRVTEGACVTWCFTQVSPRRTCRGPLLRCAVLGRALLWRSAGRPTNPAPPPSWLLPQETHKSKRRASLC